MKKSISFLAMAAILFASCSKNSVTPAANNPVTDHIGASAKAKPVNQAPGGGGGGGNGGGGGSPAPVSNTDIFAKQLTAGWLSTFATNEQVPGLPPGNFGTIRLVITLNANGTFTLVSTDSITGAQVHNNGTWRFSIPANLPNNTNGVLVLTSGGTTLMSGYFLFVRNGVLSYQTTINHLDKTINMSNYIFQRN